MNRRRVLTALASLPLVTARAAAHAGVGPPAGAVVPGLGPHIRLSCNLYSFNAPLRSGAMSLEQVLEYCAALGFDAVDPTGYYFSSYPDVPPDREVYRLKSLAFRLGLDVSGTGVRNDFALADAGRRAQELEHVKRWIPVAAKLGAPVLRVFAGLEHPDAPAREELMRWIVEGTEASVAEGERHGVMIVHQNHYDALKTADEAVELRRRIPSPWFGLNVDIGSLRSADPYEDIARLAPHACTWQLKELVYPNNRPEPTDVPRVMAIIREARYRGYVPIETLGPGDPREKVRRFLDVVRAAL